MQQALSERGITRVAGVLLDLGVSSPQLDEAGRGFSFAREGPLDMRMDPTRGESAADWLARAEEKEIREVIQAYGEERFAKGIARAIVAARDTGRIGSTTQLAAIVGGAVRTREPGQHPATRTFQALRIHVNQELEELEMTLSRLPSLLETGGRAGGHRLPLARRPHREERLPRAIARGLLSEGAADPRFRTARRRR
jgi:16S rRNA (cytosine1402-N4)-methyltransferase